MKEKFTVGHGIGCVVFTAEGHDASDAPRPIALVFTAKQAEGLAIKLIQQAGYSRHSADVAKDRAVGLR